MEKRDVCHGCSRAQGGGFVVRGTGVNGNGHLPRDCCTMGWLGRLGESLEKVSFCGEARQSAHHITPLGLCLLPGKRTSPNPSKPHALHAPLNTIPTPMVQRPYPVHGPSPLPVLLGGWSPARWESIENNPEAGTFPAPQPLLASALGILGTRTRDLWGDHGTNT